MTSGRKRGRHGKRRGRTDGEMGSSGHSIAVEANSSVSSVLKPTDGMETPAEGAVEDMKQNPDAVADGNSYLKINMMNFQEDAMNSSDELKKLKRQEDILENDNKKLPVQN